MSLNADDFPNHWRVVPIDHVAFFQEGPGVRTHQYTESGVKLLNGSNINGGFLDLSKTDRYISDSEAFGKYKHFLVEPGDLLIACSGVVVDKFEGKIAYAEEEHLPLCMNTSTMRFRSLNEDVLYLDYFRRFLQTSFFKTQLQKLITGSAQLNFGPSHIKQMVVPLPPLPEQKRIAAILDKADAIRRKRQQAIQLADDFLRAVFLDMFGDPVTNPKGWEVKQLGDVLKLSSGNGLSAKEMDSSGSYPVYGGNGVNGHHSEYMFKEPKLVIGRVGAYCGVVHITQPYSWVTDNALYVKDFVREVNIHYLAQLLDISNLNQYAGKAAQPLVSGNRIYPLEMIFPPLHDQIKFEAIKVKYLESAKGFDYALLGVEAMFSSLSQKAFRGEL